MREVVALALAAGTAASPFGRKDKWHFEKKPHGWPKPSLYTPPQPTPSTYSKMGPTAVYPTPTGGYNGTATSTLATYPSSTSVLNACASVAQLYVADPAETPRVPAKLAYDCITSIPFNSSAATELLDSIRPYLDWQTTLDYVKEPPAEYAEKIQAPYDFFGEFERIYNTAESDGYGNEYEFGFDLYEAFQKVHDGHFVYYPDSVTGIFSWGRTTPLVSISLDGESVPEVYAYEDVLTMSFGNATFTPSPLTEIDGQNSTEFLLNWSQYGSLQDRDALWNNLFYTLAQVALGSSGTGTGTFSGGGRGARIYPGEKTTLTFANGTTVVNENFARVLAPFDNVTSGEDIYRQFFTIPDGKPQSVYDIATSTTSTSSAASTSSTASSTSTPTVPMPGYPTPIVRGGGNVNSGYFLSGEDYEDVAVLALNSFSGSESQLNYQAVNTYLIDQAVAQNKTKLIIDVSANGGGTILQGYDVFTQLFPQILPQGNDRFRAHEAYDLIGQEVSKYSGQFPRTLSLNDSVQEIVSSAFNYRTDATEDYEPFSSWAEKYGPHAYGPGDDEFTTLQRWNLSDPLTPENSGGIYVSGYLNRSNITAQPFKAEYIVVVYDGYCASTCTIFSEFMRQQAGIQTIALGGRPTTDIIQAVGGVKGTNSLSWSYILGVVEIPFQTELLHDAEYYANETALGDYSDLPLLRATNYVVNARDGIRTGDEEQTPLQFVYEAADCRILYTPEMVVDQEAVWKTVADTAFGGDSSCVAGGISTAPGSYRKRSAKKHGIRRDIDLQEHAAAIGNVWTDDYAITHDGYMYV